MPVERAASSRDIVLVSLLGFLMRLLWWAAPTDLGDSVEYLQLARSLVEHHFFSADGVTASTFRPPLYPGVMAALAMAGWPSARAVLVVQELLGVATVVATYLIGRQYFERRVAVAAAVALACAPMTARFASAIMTETLFSFFLMLGVLCWARKWPWACGAMFGCAMLTRAVLLPFVALMGASAFIARAPVRTFLRQACIAAVLVVAPWVARNAIQTGRVTVADAGWAVNLYFGSVIVHAGSNPWTQLLDAASRPDAASPNAVISGILRRPTRWLRARVSQYPGLLLDAGGSLPTAANAVAFRTALARRAWPTLFFKAGFTLGNLAVAIAAGLGLWRARARLQELAPLWTFPLYMMVAHVPMYVEPRYGLPLEPFLLLCAASLLSTAEDAERAPLPV